ncbi:hypothetical protein CAS74_002064 [Pichia kudriavzevii]|uniref:Protein YIP n=1 Tax=Pichia kudriavzevii TaxID=4909 RepID=A0A1Z8JP14_PICKU|nr:hypothetical protein CAS74_002064 [Pichia kudriavzevii]
MSYNKLETTDNVDFGSSPTDVHGDDYEDIFIEPDVPTNSNKPNEPKLTPVEPAPINEPQSGSTPFFNFSNFIQPQLPSFVQIETRERPFTGGNTLDESVLTTLHRDLSTIVKKIVGNDVEDAIVSEDYSTETMKKIRDWDLWGPLVINLAFSVIITYLQSRNLDNDRKNDTSSAIFSGAFTLIWGSLSILSLNIQLLSPVQQRLENGAMTDGVVGLSFFQCISLLSYALFPVVLGGLISIFVPFKFIRMIVCALMLAWSLLSTARREEA